MSHNKDPSSGRKSSRRASIGEIAASLVCLAAIFFLSRHQGRISPSPDSKPAREQPPATMPSPSASIEQRPIEVPQGGYLGSAACKDCHQRNHAIWHASFHRTMTQLPSKKTVLGNFENATVQFEAKKFTYRTKQHSNRFWIEMPIPFWIEMPIPASQADIGRQRKEFPVVLMTGSHHLQMYWVPTGVGRNISLAPIAHLNADQRWVPVKSTFLAPPSPGLRMEKDTWNNVCFRCHSTHARKNETISAETFVYDTQVTEFGISCEACHGPGERHVAFHRPTESQASNKPEGPDPIVNPATIPHDFSSEVCGSCHSVQYPLARGQEPEQFTPGTRIGKTRHVLRRNDHSANYIKRLQPEIFSDPAEIKREFDTLFWPDGMIRVAGREFNGVSESACYQAGELSCTSCHTMHKPKSDARTLPVWADDQLHQQAITDLACLKCHQSSKYATPNHTHHTTESEGSRCYNCHMPHTTYGLLKAIRSHKITSPSAAETVRDGRPNACNLCHLDKSLAWTANDLHKNFQIDVPSLSPDEKKLSAAVIWTLKGDAGLRALTAWHMGWAPARQASGTNWMAPFLSILMEDSYDAVRYIAGRSLKTLAGYENLKYDFVGPIEERLKATKSIIALWSNGQSEILKNREDLLFDEMGNLQIGEFRRLLNVRDQTEVTLKE